MNTDEFFLLTRFSLLLKKVTPILGRLLEEELPEVIADEQQNDLHRQLFLPLSPHTLHHQDHDEHWRGTS